ncbi:OLC1v1032422C1 [Oldenlandia corymbosa var. corymbosa]|uniref:OLC1v1032422C1 n=1 Tax=Oldenlandia corymbosa var. corymbosa TaxID=529605 RepID=A0AAV1CP08_OLDCO|nr:OLC1v1032422C1 [Oldenlandia corymbosa var. corymbosa]
MSVPDAAIGYLLNNLDQVVRYNYHLIADVKDNIESLSSELKLLQGLMKDFIKYNNDSDYLKELVNSIRSIVEEAEDAVDTYVVKAALQKSKSKVNQTLHSIDYAKQLRSVGKQIEQIIDKVKKIVEGKAQGAIQILQQQTGDKIHQPAKPKEEEHVVGFDGAIEHVSKLLTKGSEKLEVISIVGMLGLGKTTLAKKVFNHQDVDYEYMIRVFVYVSRQYERREVFLKILGSISKINDELSRMSEDDLETHLRKNLEGKQYLIVLDDVWEQKDWDRLRDAFPINNKRCRVLITTRHEKVADHAKNSDTPFYKLDFLPLDKSRELLRWKVFRDNTFRDEFDKYEEQIAKKCDGLPLAIVVIAGFIVNHPTRIEWWKKVAESVNDYIARDQGQTAKVIDLMYTHLPNHLKRCFLYLGVFPEDFEIPVWKLVRLWIAEGFIPQDGSVSLEDMAEEYLDELIYRNLVIVAQRRSDDKIKTCLIHDTLHDFCKKEADKENLFQEIKKTNISSLLVNPILDQRRRLCLNNVDVLTFLSSARSGKYIRSFLNFSREETNVDVTQVSKIAKTFNLLRVLEIQSLKFTRMPIDLSNLVLLKYIAISSNLSTIPDKLTDLWNMQTLIVNTDSSSLVIKANIWKLPQFRHLHTNTSTILPSPNSTNPKKKDEVFIVQNVQTLSTISPESCTKVILSRASNIKKLGIRGNLTKLFEFKDESSLFDNLQDLGSLENLKLKNDFTSSKSKIASLPPAQNFPLQLRLLTLLGTQLDWTELNTLGKLPNLEILKLKEHAFKGKKWQSQRGGFLLLRHLHIGHTDMEEWEAEPDHFPRLKSVKLENCAKLKNVPDGLADISSLQSIVLHCTTVIRLILSFIVHCEKSRIKHSSSNPIDGNKQGISQLIVPVSTNRFKMERINRSSAYEISTHAFGVVNESSDNNNSNKRLAIMKDLIETISFLLDNIVQLLKYNYGLVADVRDNILTLRKELESLQALMRDFAKYNNDSDFLKHLVKEIRSIVEDAEDAVDDYVVQVAIQKSRTRVSKVFHTIDYAKKLRNVGKRIQQISDEVNKHVQKAQGAYHILKYQAQTLHRSPKSREEPKVEEEHVVGFDGAIEEVSQLLIGGSEQLEVISIVGMLGLGKTTLAKKVFNHQNVDYEYMIRVFVYVSKQYERKDVFLKILSSFEKVDDDVSRMSADQLEKHLCKNLKGKQYLIILDDVWEKDDWSRLKDAFPNNNKRCRVLITTRYERVAEHAKNSDTPFYRLDFLPLDKSRELLRWKVFRDDIVRDEFDKYEEQIARKCDGLPLAIVVIAGFIVNHPYRIDWWQKVAESVNDYIARDQEQTTKRGSDEKIKTCIVHDTLHEFCKKEAAKENLFQEIKKDNLSSFSGNSILDQHRRLCINNVNFSDFISSTPSGKRVRSFLTFSREDTNVDVNQVASIAKNFNLLRVLEIQSLKFPRVPFDLSNLVLLKYIAISSKVSVIPEKISCLWNMQTLIVNTDSSRLEIKANIWRLPRFRHLHTNTSTMLPSPDCKNAKQKEEVSVVQNVQTLSTIAPESCTKEILTRTSKIKKLGIRGRLTKLFGLKEELGLFGNLQDLECLESLKLVNDFNSSKIDHLPPAHSFPQQLRMLTLVRTQLDWSELFELGKLPNLEILKLKDYAFRGTKWLSEKGGFLLLKHLHIGNTDLEEWEASADHFPRLKRLELESCTKLKSIPDGLADVSDLQLVDLHCTTPELASSAVRLQQRKVMNGGNFKLSVYPPEHLKKPEI